MCVSYYTKGDKMKEKSKSFTFPIFTVIYVLYCIFFEVPSNFWLWLVLAVLGDLIFNPLYKKEEEEIEED